MITKRQKIRFRLYQMLNAYKNEKYFYCSNKFLPVFKSGMLRKNFKPAGICINIEEIKTVVGNNMSVKEVMYLAFNSHTFISTSPTSSIFIPGLYLPQKFTKRKT